MYHLAETKSTVASPYPLTKCTKFVVWTWLLSHFSKIVKNNIYLKCSFMHISMPIPCALHCTYLFLWWLLHFALVLIGRCQIDLSTLEREKSHKIEAALEDNAGIVVMHLSITGLDAPGCESDLNTFTEKPGRRQEITKQFMLKNTPKKIKEIGWLQVNTLTHFHLSRVRSTMYTHSVWLLCGRHCSFSPWCCLFFASGQPRKFLCWNLTQENVFLWFIMISFLVFLHVHITRHCTF